MTFSKRSVVGTPCSAVAFTVQVIEEEAEAPHRVVWLSITPLLLDALKYFFVAKYFSNSHSISRLQLKVVQCPFNFVSPAVTTLHIFTVNALNLTFFFANTCKRSKSILLKATGIASGLLFVPSSSHSFVAIASKSHIKYKNKRGLAGTFPHHWEKGLMLLRLIIISLDGLQFRLVP